MPTIGQERETVARRHQHGAAIGGDEFALRGAHLPGISHDLCFGGIARILDPSDYHRQTVVVQGRAEEFDDTSEIEERVRRERVDVIESRAQLEAATEAIELQRLKNESQLAEARLVMQLPDIDLETYREAEFPQQLRSGQNEMSLAEEAMVRQEKNFEFITRMASKGYRQASDIESARIDLNKARHKYETSAGTLRVLTRHERVREMTSLAAKAKL